MLDKAEKQLQTLSRHRDLKGFSRPKAVNQINHKSEIIMDYNSHHLSVCGQVWQKSLLIDYCLFLMSSWFMTLASSKAFSHTKLKAHSMYSTNNI